MFGFMASTIGAGLTILVPGSRLLCAIEGDGTARPPVSRSAARQGVAPCIVCKWCPLRLGSCGWQAQRGGAVPDHVLSHVLHLRERLVRLFVQVNDPTGDVQALPLGHFRRSCRALLVDDVRQVADVRVGCGRVLSSHLCPRGPHIPFGELRRWLPGHEVPARAECVDEDELPLEAEVFLRTDHKLKFEEYRKQL